MIKGTDGKGKFRRLKRRLDLPHYAVVGILQTIWNMTADDRPHGDIGRDTNEDIAENMGYKGDSDALIQALVAEEWLDPDPEFRLLVHDWPTHCETWVHLKLARKAEYFANGTTPSIVKLKKTERAPIEARYAENTSSAQQAQKRRTECARLAQERLRARTGHAQNERTECALPSLTKPSHNQAETNERTEGAQEAHGVPSNGSRRIDLDSKTTSTDPEEIGDIIADAGSIVNEKDDGHNKDLLTRGMADEVMSISGEPAEYRAWWIVVIDRMEKYGGLQVFVDALEWAKKSCDPVQRERKGIGEMTHPGAYLTKQCSVFLGRSGVKLPPPPVQEKSRSL